MRYNFLIFFTAILLSAGKAAAFKHDKERSKKGQSELSSSEWDSEWKSGSWSYLANTPIELSRLAVIGNVFIPSYAPTAEASILDIGCGEGLLLEYLNNTYKPGYVGMDISKEAIAKALTRRPDNKFIVSSVSDHLPTRNYDVIVFSEVLNYVDYESVLRNYELSLSAKGIVIISTFLGFNDDPPQEKHKRIITFVKSHFQLIDEIQLTGFITRGPAWKDKVKTHVIVVRCKEMKVT